MKTTRNVPALRYDLFIKAFEKEVTAAQSRIKAIEAMEQPYNLVKEALEAAKLPNDTTLSLSPSVVKIVMHALPSDFLTMFDALCTEIGSRLLTAGLHKDGIPSRTDGGWWHHLQRSWRCFDHDQPCTVMLEVELPDEGLRDLALEKIERTTTVIDYRLTPRDPATYVAPKHFRTVREEIAF